MSSADATSLMAAASEMGLSLTQQESDRLIQYLGLLEKWNKVYNLTAIRDRAEMLTHHVLDSLAAVLPLRRVLGEQNSRILDVGSGAGLPGVVLAVLEPHWAITCVDAVNKKASFVQQVASDLRLPNLRSVHARVQDLRAEPFDVITSRAFASLADFVAWTYPHLKTGGCWAAMKGKPPQAEAQALPVGVEMFHVEQLHVPGLDAERCIAWLRSRGVESIVESITPALQS